MVAGEIIVWILFVGFVLHFLSKLLEALSAAANNRKRR